MIILVHDPRGAIPADGGLYADPGDGPAMRREGVAYLPIESQENYSRAGFGSGGPMQIGGICPFGLYTGGAGELSWLYWTAMIKPAGQAPSGYLQLQSDTSRTGVQVGLSLAGAPMKVEQHEPIRGAWVLRGKCRMGSPGGWTPLRMHGTLSDAHVFVVAASCCANEYPF